MVATETLADATLNDIHDLLFATKDYARRIHWWVRLFGIIWIAAPVVAGVVFMLAIIGGALA